MQIRKSSHGVFKQYEGRTKKSDAFIKYILLIYTKERERGEKKEPTLYPSR